MKNLALFCLAFFVFLSCGVNGKPLAPLNPELMGHGLPEYDGDALDEPEDAKKNEKTSVPK